MIGHKIKKKFEVDEEKGEEKLGKETNEELFSFMDIMKLPADKQLVIYQGWYHRPIKATNIQYYLNKTPVQKELMTKIAMGEASPLPEFLIPYHHAIMGYDGAPRVYDPNTKEIKILEPIK